MSALLKAVDDPRHPTAPHQWSAPTQALTLQPITEDHLWADRTTSQAVQVNPSDLIELLWGKPYVELPGFQGQPDGPEWSTLNLVFKPASTSPAELAHRPAPKSFSISLIQGALAGMLLIGSAICGAGIYQWVYTAPMRTMPTWQIKTASTQHITIQMPLPPKRTATGKWEPQTMEAACSLPCRLPDGAVATHLDPVRRVVMTNNGELTPLSVTN